MNNFSEKVSFIWGVADLLRGDYKQSEYGRVILPLTVLRRLDSVLAPVKGQMLDTHAEVKNSTDNFGPLLDQLTEIKGLWNTSQFDLQNLLNDPDQLGQNLRTYIAAFSPQIRSILQHCDLDTQITKLERSNLLYLVVSKFVELDLHPDKVSNIEMGYLYEELIRKFSELSNETAGEHFTPREVISLMVSLLFQDDEPILTKPGITKTLFDPACGTGGMLSVAEEHLHSLNDSADLQVFGQELNPETFAICQSDMMLKGQNAEHIAFGNSFSEDGHPDRKFDYLLANPPFGVEWKKVKSEVTDEHNDLGFGGRFGAGLPRINDGSFLFLQHMISKMKPASEGGSRLAIVFNGSPLFTGAAGSGESEIRRWIIENDWLEAVVALPDQLFYNTGISTYFWIVSNRKRSERQGKIQLIDAREMFTKMRKSLGNKRKEVGPDQLATIVDLYARFEEGDHSKIFTNESFGFMRITVERPIQHRWEVSVDGLASLETDSTFAKLDEPIREAVLASLRGVAGKSYVAETDVRAQASAVLAQAGAKGKKLEDIVLAAFAVRDPDAAPLLDTKGNPLPDPDLRDNENVPLPVGRLRYETSVTDRLGTAPFVTAVDSYLTDEVLPYVPRAWVDYTKTKIGYEIPLTRHFYQYIPPRPLAEIDAELAALEQEIQVLLSEVRGA